MTEKVKDFLKDYKKRKIIGNIYIILGAFIMAFGINFLLLDGTNLENSLKTSILDSKNDFEQKSDIFLEKNSGKIILKNNKNIQEVKNISFSIVYNNEELELKNANSKFGKVETLGEKGTGIETFFINFDDLNIDSLQDLAEIEFEKKGTESTNITILNSNFTDKNENTFGLTTSGLTL